MTFSTAVEQARRAKELAHEQGNNAIENIAASIGNLAIALQNQAAQQHKTLSEQLAHMQGQLDELTELVQRLC